jgi:hypothetical protein
MPRGNHFSRGGRLTGQDNCRIEGMQLSAEPVMPLWICPVQACPLGVLFHLFSCRSFGTPRTAAFNDGQIRGKSLESEKIAVLS